MPAQNTHLCFAFESVEYITFPRPLSITASDLSLPIDDVNDDRPYVFFTCIHWDTEPFDAGSFRRAKSRLCSSDDVWTLHFLDGKALQGIC